MLDVLLAMQGEKAFLDMVSQTIGKQAFNVLKNQFSGNQKDFIRGLLDMMADMGAASFNNPAPSDYLPPPANAPAPVNPPPRNKNRPPSEIQKDFFDD